MQHYPVGATGRRLKPRHQQRQRRELREAGEVTYPNAPPEAEWGDVSHDMSVHQRPGVAKMRVLKEVEVLCFEGTSTSPLQDESCCTL
jgi:hypothetical protein